MTEIPKIDIFALKDAAEKHVFDIPGVVGVGVGHGSGPRLNIYVEKITEEILDAIPGEIAGHVVQVVESGRFRSIVQLAKAKLYDARKLSPVPGGVSAGHFLITAGTNGTSCIDNTTQQPVFISNNHVFANEDNDTEIRASVGDHILQPGAIDGGKDPSDTIGTLLRWQKILTKSDNIVDCAIAKPIDITDAITDIDKIGSYNGWADPVLGEKVKKSGRTTGLTAGQIMDVDATIDVDYGQFTARFTHQIISDMTSGGGDSGSMVLNENNAVVGLLFAGSTNLTAANKISNVQTALNVSFGAQGAGGTPYSSFEFDVLPFSVIMSISLLAILLGSGGKGL